MIKLYEVQTYIGNHHKTFQNPRNAMKYKQSLINKFGFEPDYIEINPVDVTRDEFIYIDIED